jgi:hypothetical protein
MSAGALLVGGHPEDRSSDVDFEERSLNDEASRILQRLLFSL